MKSFHVEFTYSLNESNQEILPILFGYEGPTLEDGRYYSTSTKEK